jgi:membrane-bound ClpP family serine protease
VNSRTVGALGLLGAGALAAVAWGRFFPRPAARRALPPAYLGQTPVIALVNQVIAVSDAARITTRLSELGDQPAVMLIHTLGGPLQPVVQIARAVHRHGKVAVFVPFHALSGGTLIALAAESIHMWPHATLGPVDPQIGPFSASSLLAVLEAKPVEAIDDHTLALAHEAKKAIQQTAELTTAFVGERPALVRRLVAGVTTHSYPISLEEARAMGLEVHAAEPHAAARAFVRALVPAKEIGPWESFDLR